MRELVPEFKEVADSDIVIETLSGGITNICNYFLFFSLFYLLLIFSYWELIIFHHAYHNSFHLTYIYIIIKYRYKQYAQYYWYSYNYNLIINNCNMQKTILTFHLVFQVSSKKIPDRAGEIPLVVRIYGNNTEAIIDRKKELKVIIIYCSFRVRSLIRTRESILVFLSFIYLFYFIVIWYCVTLVNWFIVP